MWLDVSDVKLSGWHRGLMRQWCSDICQREFFAVRGEPNLQEQAYQLLSQFVGPRPDLAIDQVEALLYATRAELEDLALV